jgi:hypothetical protein
MAIELNFSFNNDAHALEIFQEFCNYNDYEQNKEPGETKKEFVIRTTKEWWKEQAASGKAQSDKLEYKQSYKVFLDGVEID